MKISLPAITAATLLLSTTIALPTPPKAVNEADPKATYRRDIDADPNATYKRRDDRDATEKRDADVEADPNATYKRGTEAVTDPSATYRRDSNSDPNATY